MVEQDVLAARAAARIADRARREGTTAEGVVRALVASRHGDESQLPTLLANLARGEEILREYAVFETEPRFQVEPPPADAVAWATEPVAGGRVMTVWLVRRA